MRTNFEKIAGAIFNMVMLLHHGPEGVRAGIARIILPNSLKLLPLILLPGGLFCLYGAPGVFDENQFRKKRPERFLTW